MSKQNISILLYLDLTEEEVKRLWSLLGGVDLSTLLRDALGEFVATRNGNYVEKRYSESDAKFRDFKLRETRKRQEVATLLAKFQAEINLEEATDE